MSNDFSDYLLRLSSNDANDRVKAAAELGEIGTPEVAPNLLKAAYDDEASTVRQMAIQSYAEILGNNAYSEILKAAKNHFDDYVRLYAVSTLGKVFGENEPSDIKFLLEDKDEKIRAAAVKIILQNNLNNFAPLFLKMLDKETYDIGIRNLIEALGLWKYKEANAKINQILKNTKSLEIKTICYFSLAIFGNEEAIYKIKNDDIDEFMRIYYEGNRYHGRDGLLVIIEQLS